MKFLRQLRIRFPRAVGMLLGCVSLQRGEAAKLSLDAKDFFVYFGTYTGVKSKGIYVSRFDSAVAKLSAANLAAETANPSFLAIHPNHKFLYAANEVSEVAGKKSGPASAFVINSHTAKR